MESSPVLRPSARDNQPLPAQQQAKLPVEGWAQIRALDEVENWSERTRVVSKSDHQYYTECAHEFIHEIVDSFPTVGSSRVEWSGVRAGDVERSGVRAGDVERSRVRAGDVERSGIRAGNGPQDAFQYMNEFTDQDFQGSAAQFDVDYLEKMSSTSAEPSALTRQSLYVKFDPLVGGGSPRGTAGHTPHIQAVARVGSNDLLMLNTPPHEYSIQSTGSSRSHDFFHSSATPSSMPSSLSGKGTLHSTSSHLNSTLLDSSPVLQGPTHMATPTSTPHYIPRIPESDELVKVLKFGDEDVRQMVETAREQERAKLEQTLTALREELARSEARWGEEVGKREGATQRRVERAQRESQDLKAEITMQITDKGKLEEELQTCKELIISHEKTEAEVLDKYGELKTELKKVEHQRDQTMRDFESLEKSFADLHQRYLKLKTASQTLQQNEEDLKRYISELEVGQRSAEEKAQQLQLEVQQKLDEANSTFEALRKEHASELAVAKVNVKKLTLQVASLEKAVRQKEQEKDEISQICDELMSELRSSQHD